ncbi:MAG: 2-phosphosulfolactate phosphatase [Chloroflexi bacterium]|nr:2-phosphosulfolactate phosphatase [Chloroflexota bacterium]MCY3957357.1 2-phosphosulfolactate phosphatase [Chloroflexota bacterium]
MTVVRVELLPGTLPPDPQGVCAVVDVIRATTTLVAMAEAGDPEVWIAGDIDAARQAASQLGPDTLLCGERGGLPPEGFDHGNSPREFQDTDLTGRRAVLSTTNGAYAIERWGHSRRTCIAALRNAGAVAERLLEDPAATSISIACAGRSGALALDDLYTAGVIVQRLLQNSRELKLDESAVAALHVAAAYPSAQAALPATRSAQALKPVGLWDDVTACAQVDVSQAVPEVGNQGCIRIWREAERAGRAS